MNLSHIGKIGRLPHTIREELNRRLHNGEGGEDLLNWLNSHPEVKRVIAADFGGQPIGKQNLSAWRNGGYKEWLRKLETLEAVNSFLAEINELEQTIAEPLTEKLALWLVTRYVVETRKLGGKDANGEIDRKLLREFCGDVVALRRGNHSAARLKIEQERLEREREKTEEEVLAKIEEWAENDKVRDCLCKEWLSPEERKAAIEAILFPRGRPLEKVPPPASGSNPVKPGQTDSDPIHPDSTDSDDDNADSDDDENPT